MTKLITKEELKISEEYKRIERIKQLTEEATLKVEKYFSKKS